MLLEKDTALQKKNRQDYVRTQIIKMALPPIVCSLFDPLKKEYKKMEEIQLANFKQDIYGIIQSIVHSHKPVMISDKGKYLVKIVPIPYSEPDSWLGCMSGKGKIIGYIISPAEDTDNWKVL